MSFDLDYLYNDLAGNPTIVKKTINGRTLSHMPP